MSAIAGLPVPPVVCITVRGASGTAVQCAVTDISVKVGALLIEGRRNDGATVKATVYLTPALWAQARALGDANSMPTFLIDKKVGLRVSPGYWPTFRTAADLAFGLPAPAPRSIEFERDATGRPIRGVIR